MNPRLNAADLANSPIILAQSGVAVSAAPNDTSINVLASIQLAAGIMGPHGGLRVTTLWTVTASANSKNLQVMLGGLGGSGLMGVGLTQASMRHQLEIRNRGAMNSQVAFAGNQGGFTATTGANLVAAIDTSIAQTLLITGQKVLGTEVLTLEAYLVELLSSL